MPSFHVVIVILTTIASQNSAIRDTRITANGRHASARRDMVQHISCVARRTKSWNISLRGNMSTARWYARFPLSRPLINRATRNWVLHARSSPRDNTLNPMLTQQTESLPSSICCRQSCQTWHQYVASTALGNSP